MFDKLEYVCRYVRESEIIFGGLQVIFSGDFFQLPPIKNILYGDNGNHCFKSLNWKFVHHVNLTEVRRQNDHILIHAINKLAQGGNIPDDVNKFMLSLQRPLPPGPPSLKLFATNAQVSEIDLLDDIAELFKFYC